MATVTVTLKTDVPASSIKGVRDLSKEFKGLDQASAGLKIQFNDTFSVLKGVLGADAIKAGLGALSDGAQKLFKLLITDGVNAAQQEQDALQALNVALARSGDFSLAASEDFAAFADAVEKSTKVSGEAVLEAAALAKVYGQTNEETKRLTQAAIELSSVTGDTLDTAVEKLGKTYAGTAGRLADTIPGLRELSKEQLKAGDAIDVVLQQLGGTATGKLNTFSGATAQLGVATEDITKKFGFAVIENSALIAGVREATKIFQEWGGDLENNKSQLQQLVTDGFLGVLDSLALMVNFFDPIARAGQIAFNGILGAAQALKLGLYTSVIGPIGLVAKAISLIPGAGEEAAKTAESIGNAMAEMAADLNGSAAAIDRAIAGPTDTARSLEDGILRIRDAAVAGASGQRPLNAELERLSRSAAGATSTVAALTEEQKKLGDEGERLAEQLAKQDPSAKYQADLLALQAALEQKRILEEEYFLAQAELEFARNEAVSAKYEEEAQKLIDQNQRLMEIDAIYHADSIEQNNARLKEILASEKLTARDRERVARDVAAAEARVERDRLNATRDTLGQVTQLFGEHTAAYTAAASINATIAAFEGANKAASALAGVPIVGPGLAAAAAALFIANGLKNVAAINGVKLATGLTEVPAGYPNDTFPAQLTSGERVVNVQQNRDLTDFIQGEAGNRDLLEQILGVLIQMANQPVPAVIGSEQVFEAVNSQLQSGRRLSA
jgi:hypothetical protein